MKNIIIGMSILIMFATSSAVLAESNLLRLYTDRDKGDTKYYVINPAHINYVEWDEDDSLLKIVTNENKKGESIFLVPIKSNKDAQAFIEILMGQSADMWLEADHK